MLNITLHWKFYVKHHCVRKFLTSITLGWEFFDKHHFEMGINTLKTFASPALGCILKMDAADFIETLTLISHTTRHHISEARSFDIHRLEELWCQKR
jgi:hypothetical protein